MNRSTLALAVILAAFGAYSLYAMLEHGYFGIWQAGLANAAAGQILFDLIVALLLVMGWMIRDARATGRNPWPYVVVTLAAGSFGPLAYLLVGALQGSRRADFSPLGGLRNQG
jgi:hypothetical protein